MADNDEKWMRGLWVVVAWGICQLAIAILAFGLAGCGAAYHAARDGLMR
jgi:hypothetical protein